MENRQNDLINVIKGLTMFLLLWGHCLQYFSIEAVDFFDISAYKVLQSVCMPLFAMVSGYLFWYSLCKRTFIDSVTRRTRQMLQPMVMCGTFLYLTFDLLVNIKKGGVSALADFFVKGIMTEAFTKYWFLWCTLSCSIAVAMVWKGIKKPAYRAPALLLGFFVLCLFPKTERSIYLYPYFALGFVFHEYEAPLKSRLEKLRVIPLIVYPILCCFFRREHVIDVTGLLGGGTISESLRIDAFRWLIGLFGCIFIVVILRWFYGKFNKGAAEKIFDFFTLIGKKSLQIYCLQTIILERWAYEVFKGLVKMAGRNFLYIEWLFPYVFTLLLAVVFTWLLLKLIDWLDKKGISQYLFGR